MTNKISEVCMAKNSNNGEIIRQELITYKNAKNGVVRHSIERVFCKSVTGENAFAESRNTTPILKLDHT